jgi:hypothetical protein
MSLQDKDRIIWMRKETEAKNFACTIKVSSDLIDFV